VDRAGPGLAAGLSGEFSVYAEWQGFGLMFHVANLMPLAPNDPQQVRCVCVRARMYVGVWVPARKEKDCVQRGKRRVTH
jgi:hypothetical protein